ncbi:MAG: bile acid:sodium symporter [Desulfobacterales bacterium]|jgi:BASS family bile acid:Na+ symporter
MDNPIILHFVTLTIFSLMFAIGVNHSYEQLTSLWRRPELLLRSLLAVIVLVPLVVLILLWLFDLPPAVAAGLTILAAAPGAPLTTRRSQMAGGDPTYSASLQLTLALLAVVITPLILAIFYALFELDIERVTPFQVVLQIGEVTFLPVIIGLLIQRFAPKLAGAIGKTVQVIGNVLFLLLLFLIVVILVIAPDFRAMLNLGGPPIAAILIMVAAALAVGHLLGGPTRQQRSSLAIACIARNVGLAVFIAGLFDYGRAFIPTLLTYMILGAILAFPYGAWNKRRIT